jgi:hypothetical protein
VNFPDLSNVRIEINNSTKAIENPFFGFSVSPSTAKSDEYSRFKGDYFIALFLNTLYDWTDGEKCRTFLLYFTLGATDSIGD